MTGRMTDPLVFAPAAKLARLLRLRRLSATELVRAFIAQVERVNPKVNAIVTFLPEPALERSPGDEAPREARGAVKDERGVVRHVGAVAARSEGTSRTTHGSPIARRPASNDIPASRPRPKNPYVGGLRAAVW